MRAVLALRWGIVAGYKFENLQLDPSCLPPVCTNLQTTPSLMQQISLLACAARSSVDCKHYVEFVYDEHVRMSSDNLCVTANLPPVLSLTLSMFDFQTFNGKVFDPISGYLSLFWSGNTTSFTGCELVGRWNEWVDTAPPCAQTPADVTYMPMLQFTEYGWVTLPIEEFRQNFLKFRQLLISVDGSNCPNSLSAVSMSSVHVPIIFSGFLSGGNKEIVVKYVALITLFGLGVFF
eukprot:Gregarina_sp_Poly_1__2835@NODE_1790_length_3326_cov_370_843510_g1166_i0_p2_GENE_NODE_1790_length_3326_cov_370_843510_g1166_i0NODE_1790_length_3326_cov_370_843510_g1166_i0_p2_ORF_typecomplete_len234_score17_64_NODE_1790_length_3326_cov_370_843510_g1166_i011851886